MLKTVLVDPATGKSLHIETVDGEFLLITSNLAKLHGTFKSSSRSTAGTTIITSPLGDGAIVLTDLIISTDRVVNSTVVVHYTDGVETIDIYAGDSSDAPINFAIPFAGNFTGWKDARIELVTTSTVSATAVIGYYRVDTGDQFSVWDARR